MAFNALLPKILPPDLKTSAHFFLLTRYVSKPIYTSMYRNEHIFFTILLKLNPTSHVRKYVLQNEKKAPKQCPILGFVNLIKAPD